MNSFKKRVLVIGLDCADFRFITPLVKEGRLPNIARLLQNGVSANLLSTIPPTSAPAWASFMTGKNPGKTGIFDFQVRVEKSYETRFVNSNDIKSKTLWRLLSEAGKKVIVVNVPLTYPPEKVNGILISGLLTPPGSVFTYPPELSRDLMDKGYTIEGKIYANQNKTLKSLLHADKKRVKITKHLAKDMDWDFLMVMFTATDRVVHSMWNDVDKINSCYELMDSLIGDLFRTIGCNSHVFIVSDHGAQFVPYTFYINQWLAQKSLLNYKINDSILSRCQLNQKYRSRGSFLQNVGKIFGYILQNIEIDTGTLINLSNTRWLKWVRQIVPIALRHNLYSHENISIIWRKTKAYLVSKDSPGLRINLKGREPKGVVAENEYDVLREKLIVELLKIKNKITGQKIFKHVYKREDFYNGQFIDDAPDIIFLPDGLLHVMNGTQKSDALFLKNIKASGRHRMEGIFISSGKGIKRGYLVDDLSIFDLTPTILHILDVPIPEDVDGRVIREMFESSSDFLKKEIRYSESSMIIKRENDILEEGRDDESIKKRLSALGYL
ncbi:alkaline phosphatase family protein [candidate division WOR-3 bacterium]|nr:alkaline phosphatase family protein [candidate division WOR-3 bacterium]